MDLLDKFESESFRISLWQRIVIFFTGRSIDNNELTKALHVVKSERDSARVQLNDAEGLYITRAAQIDSLNTKLLEMSKINGSLERRNEVAESENSSIIEINNGLRLQNETFESEMNNAFTESKTNKKSATTLQHSIDDLSKEIETSKKELAQARRKLTLSDKKFNRLQEIIDTYENNESYELADKISQKNKENMYLDAENHELKQEVEKLTKQRDQALADAEAYKSEFEDLGPTGNDGPS